MRTMSVTARQELRNAKGLSDEMRKKLDQLDAGECTAYGACACKCLKY